MPRPQTIKIVTLPSNDKAVITAAKIGLIATIIAALITAFAYLLGTAMTVIMSWQQKIECCWIPKDDWRQIARDNGWIPKSECPWETTRVTGRDKNNKEVKVQIHLLSGEYRWVYTSSTEAELGDKKADLNAIIRGLEVDPKSKFIVAVGMASVEGDFAGQSVLSKERTDKLISLIKEELKPRIPVHGLSLGRYIDEKARSNPRETSDQRRVVVIEVLEREDNAVLEDAVYDALIRARTASPRIPFDVTNYKDRDYTDHDFGKQ